jgi:hypothetical protein
MTEDPLGSLKAAADVLRSKSAVCFCAPVPRVGAPNGDRRVIKVQRQGPSMPRRKKPPEIYLQDLAGFRASLWRTLAVNAKTLTGLQVVKALRIISDDVYYAGIDAAYTATKVHDARNVADAWDLTWLTALNIRLLHLRQAGPSRKSSRR